MPAVDFNLEHTLAAAAAAAAVVVVVVVVRGGGGGGGGGGGECHHDRAAAASHDHNQPMPPSHTLTRGIWGTPVSACSDSGMGGGMGLEAAWCSA